MLKLLGMVEGNQRYQVLEVFVVLHYVWSGKFLHIYFQLQHTVQIHYQFAILLEMEFEMIQWHRLLIPEMGNPE